MSKPQKLPPYGGFLSKETNSQRNRRLYDEVGSQKVSQSSEYSQTQSSLDENSQLNSSLFTTTPVSTKLFIPYNRIIKSHCLKFEK